MGTIKWVRRTRKRNNSLGIDYVLSAQCDSAIVEFEEFVTHMSEHNSPYSRGVIHGVLTDMLDCLKEFILDGKRVRFGELGILSVALKSGLSESPDTSPNEQIKGVKVLLRNTKTWSNTELKKKVRFVEAAEYDNFKTDGKEGENTDPDPGNGE